MRKILVEVGLTEKNERSLSDFIYRRDGRSSAVLGEKEWVVSKQGDSGRGAIKSMPR